jgi:Mid domain of argonaute
MEARVLPTPQIQYHQTSKLQGALTPQNGVWNLVGQKVCAGADLGSWAVVCFSTQHSLPEPSIGAFIREFCNAAVDCGVLFLKVELTVDDCA